MTQRASQLDSVFRALADPTRRAVLSRLAAGSASVSELAADFDMALPSFMGHLAKLESAGLIATTKDRRVRTCALRPEAVAPVQHWLDAQRQLWEARFDRLEDYISTLAKDPTP